VGADATGGNRAVRGSVHPRVMSALVVVIERTGTAGCHYGTHDGSRERDPVNGWAGARQKSCQDRYADQKGDLGLGQFEEVAERPRPTMGQYSRRKRRVGARSGMRQVLELFRQLYQKLSRFASGPPHPELVHPEAPAAPE